METKAIVTMPPYAPYIREVLRHPIVSGIRLNTVMPVKEPLQDLVKRLDKEAKQFGKELWIDLKCRQLRIKTYGVPPFTEIELTHNISVATPVKAYFSDGKEQATILKVEGNKLIMQEGPKRVVGPGESINIPDPSLKVDGYLTETDKEYIKAARRAGLHNYMISFVERYEDLEEVYKRDPKADIINKIESKKGLEYIENEWDGCTKLMAARGDLYLELDRPHEIIKAVELISLRDYAPIVASRIFSSLTYELEPSCEDIGDVDNLLRLDYRNFMFGDDICMRKDSIISGLNLLQAMSKDYK